MSKSVQSVRPLRRKNSVLRNKNGDAENLSPSLSVVPLLDRLEVAQSNRTSSRNFVLPSILSGWNLALALNGYDPEKGLSKIDPLMTEQTRAIGVAEEAIRRAVLVGALQCSSAINPDCTSLRFRLFRLSDAKVWAGKSHRYPKFTGSEKPTSTGITRQLEEDLLSERECAFLLSTLKPNSVRSELTKLISDSIELGDLAAIIDPNSSFGDEIYRTSRFIKPSDLVQWARQTGRYPEFVSIARKAGLEIDNTGMADSLQERPSQVVPASSPRGGPSMLVEVRAEESETRRKAGRKRSTEVQLRRELVKKHASKPSILDDPKTQKILFAELARARIPLPNKDGRKRPQSWTNLRGELKATIISTLKKDLQRHK